VRPVADISDHLGAPVAPPRDWFEPPDDLREDRYLTVTEDGRLYGRFYTRGVPLIDDDGTERVPPPSPTGYALYHRASVLCDDGTDLEVGAVTLSGHGASNYDDARNIAAVVRAGDDDLGGWIAGAVVPEATRQDAAMLRRGQLSGEWVVEGDAWFNSHRVEPGAGLELSGLVSCVTGRAVLHTTYKGWPASVHRLSVDEIERKVAAYRTAFDREIREVLDGNPPVVAVDILRRALDESDEKSFLRRKAEVLADEVTLPEERIPTPFPMRSSAAARPTP
jgi:hypothetical protein